MSEVARPGRFILRNVSSNFRPSFGIAMLFFRAVKRAPLAGQAGRRPPLARQKGTHPMRHIPRYYEKLVEGLERSGLR